MEDNAGSDFVIWPFGRRCVIVDLPDDGYAQSLLNRLTKIGWDAVLVRPEDAGAQGAPAALISDRPESIEVVKWLMPEVLTVLISDGGDPSGYADRIVKWTDPLFHPQTWGPLAYLW